MNRLQRFKRAATPCKPITAPVPTPKPDLRLDIFLGLTITLATLIAVYLLDAYLFAILNP